MATTMFQVSDLAGSRRREFLDKAKLGSVSLRDTDGSVLTMLPAERMAAIGEAASAASMLFSAVLRETIQGGVTTANVLHDPLRRAVLTG